MCADIPLPCGSSDREGVSGGTSSIYASLLGACKTPKLITAFSYNFHLWAFKVRRKAAVSATTSVANSLLRGVGVNFVSLSHCMLYVPCSKCTMAHASAYLALSRAQHHYCGTPPKQEGARHLRDINILYACKTPRACFDSPFPDVACCKLIAFTSMIWLSGC